MRNSISGSSGTSYAASGVAGGRFGASPLASRVTRELPHSQERSRASVWHWPLTWFVLLPLLYLTMEANLVPDTGDVALRVTNTDQGGITHRAPLVLVMLICSGLIFTHRSRIFAMCQKMKLILSVPIFAMASVLWSAIPGHTLMSAVFILVLTLFAVYVSSRYSPSQQLELFAFTGAVAIVLSALCMCVSPTTFASPLGWIGIFGHKQNCAAMGTLFLITLLHWTPPSNLYRVLRGLFVVLCLLFIVMSQSRTGWGLCALALGLSACLRLWQKVRSKEGLAVILLLVPIVLAIGLGLYQYSADLLHAVGKDPTLNQRTIIWSAAVDAAKEHPILGYGYAAFWRGLEGPSLQIILISDWQLWQAQDGYLDLALQLGVAGVALLVFLIAQACRNAARCFRGSPNSVYVRWCVVVVICCLIYDIGETSLFIQRMPWFFFLSACIGLSMAARELKPNEASPGRKLKRTKSPAYPLLGVRSGYLP